MRCYCLEEAKIYKELNANDEIEKNYPIEYWLTKSSEQKLNFTDWSGEPRSEPVCKFFGEQTLDALWMSNACKYAVIIINTVIRMAIMIIIKEVGCGTHSK